MDEVERAADRVAARFPFPNLFEARRAPCIATAEQVKNHLPASSTVLDFGAGAADRVAVLAELGYRCTAADDLGDVWHLQQSNRERILRFAEAAGIDYRVIEDERLPFEAKSFDMVMLCDVLEHLPYSPRPLLMRLVELLVPGGLLLIQVPNAVNIRKRIAVVRGRTNYQPYDWLYWSDDVPYRGHNREYVREDLEGLARNLGLETVELTGCHDIALERGRLRRLAATLYFGLTLLIAGGRDSWLLITRKPDRWRPLTRDPAALEEEKMSSRLLRARE